jgi:sterol desaturase/sphingolipid hydroxylase (fatty acid hydroxylase superfamily)
VDRTFAAIEQMLASWGNQLGGTFLLPGSTHSLGALIGSLAVFVMLAIPLRRKRPTGLKLLARVLLPRRLLHSASGRLDLAYFVIGLLFSGLLIGWAVFSADQVRGLATHILGAPGARILPVWMCAAIATLTLFLAYEFAYWLDHWLMHRIPLLWRFHKVHHQAESLSLFTNWWVHPVETIGFFNLQALVLGVTGAMLEQLLGSGVSPWSLGGTNLLIMLAAVFVTHLQHSHLWVRFGPRWGRVLLGPAHHQIHHSADPAHFDRNLGSSLALFDRLFGTFHMPEAKREKLRFGVDDGETDPHGVRAALLAPFIPDPRPSGILQPSA